MKFSLHIGSEISLESFSLSQLIVMIKNLFDTEGLPGFLSAFLQVIEAKVIEAGVQCPHCQSAKVNVHSTKTRNLKTSLGKVVLSLLRYQCLSCRRTFVPMNTLLDLDPYARKSREYEKLSLETVTQQSFRRSSQCLHDTLGFATPHTTLHRWFYQTTATNISVKKRVENLIADGTGYKKKPDEKESNRGEVRVMVGLTQDGDIVPYGAWTRASWKDIGRYVKKENHPSPDKLKFKPIAETLISDGEEELVRALKKLANNHQRCLFHMTYELEPLLQYKDAVSKDEAKKLADELGNILYVELPAVDADPLKNIEEKLKIELHLKEIRERLDAFINDLRIMGYRKAFTFVKNAKEQLFTYIETWLETGIANPRVTSLVERMMREIKRRIKKIGFGWSEHGAQQMTRLVLLQLSTTKRYWENYWQIRMGTNSNIKLFYLGTTVSSQ